MAATFGKLDNLVALLDKNGLMATGVISERFEIGRSYVTREGTEAVVFAGGIMVSKALDPSSTVWSEFRGPT